MKSFLPLFLLPLLLFSQEQDTTDQCRFLVGIHVTPNYSYRFLKFTGSISSLSKIRDKNEKAAFRYAIGLSSTYKLNSRIEFGLGVIYSDKGYDFANLNLISNGGSEILSLKMNYHYEYLEFPVELNYKLKGIKRKTFFTLGISPGIYLNYRNHVTISYTDGRIEESSQSPGTAFTKLRQFNVTMYAGIGSYFKLNKHIALRIEPVFTSSLISILESDVELKERLYSFGIMTGVYFKM
jgi:hypothetical protein